MIHLISSPFDKFYLIPHDRLYFIPPSSHDPSLLCLIRSRTNYTFLVYRFQANQRNKACRTQGINSGEELENIYFNKEQEQKKKNRDDNR